ncbi:arsenic transporter [Paenibacillus camelliae]|uniref:arsenic transporter n=1 Tax=Paenibacillus camelliae TaxID=512410 RepID=UPI00203A7502|nr:arsenic transporter [Paenibacillus camelliae]
MVESLLLTAGSIFIITVALLILRPYRMNEAIPVTIGAIAIYIFGIVSFQDVISIIGIVNGAAITILSTIVMSIVLESIGFFRWAAFNLAIRSQGSGRALFWYINVICFLMTMFFNNDGSILITTPIIIQTLNVLNLKTRQKIPYLLSGALIATGASAPIGVSNLANLISLKIVGLDLNAYATMMLIPSMIGLLSISFLLFFHFRKEIPVHIPVIHRDTAEWFQQSTNRSSNMRRIHPLMPTTAANPPSSSIDWRMFVICIIIVILTRISFFVLQPLGISTEWPAIVGALLLIAVRWLRKGIAPTDIASKTPWHILLFALGMYVIVYGLYNAGLIEIIISQLGEYVADNRFNAIFIIGLLLSFMSNLFNNLPSVMIGTLSLTEMHLEPSILHAGYFASIIGADIGALILPMGTLASLLWMHILREHNIHFTWRKYIKTTLVVIPISLLISFTSLYYWLELFY